MIGRGVRILGLGTAMLLALGACAVVGGVTGPPDDRGFVDSRWFERRQDDYLAFATGELNLSSPLNILAHGERAARDRSYDFDWTQVTPDGFAAMFAEIDAFEDTTDFDMLYLLNLWYSYGDELPVETRTALEQRFLGFKYWYTEPTPDGLIDDKWYWSENHRIIFHTIELLAAQAFPDATFANDGRSAASHRADAEARILEWIDEKVAFGFSEWHSDVYYQKDVTPLLTLVEFAENPAIVARAEMMLDWVLLDIATHLQNGNLGATHGRSYMKDKSVATDQDVFGLAKLLFDDTTEPYQSRGDAGATLLARARNYRLPQAILTIARSDETMVDRERMGVPIDPFAPIEPDPAGPYGYDWDDPDDVPFFWERGAQITWQGVNMTIETLDQYGLWDNSFFSPFKPLRDLVAGDPAAARGLARDLAPQLNFGLLSEVNTYTYRAPDVMLSTAQDHRPGMFGEQYHAWQATLDENAIVFTTHPSNEPEVGTQWPDSDGYWTGTGTMPRSAQHGPAAVHVYSPGFVPAPVPPLDIFTYLDYTHAFFPQERFDEVVDAGHWTFARRGDGYVALWSYREPQWRVHDPSVVHTDGMTMPFDLVAPGGPDNVWIVEVGDAATYGSFASFRSAVGSASVSATPRPVGGNGLPGGFDVTFDSPGAGLMRFGSDGPLTVDGTDVDIADYPRVDNPWTQVPFGDRVVEVAAGNATLKLDFDSGVRTVGFTGRCPDKAKGSPPSHAFRSGNGPPACLAD